MKTAFIPTSNADFSIATRCADRCRSLGWEPILLVTERDFACGPPPGAVMCDYDRQGWGMYGNWCAYEILRKMEEHAPDGMAMKIDADTALLAAGSEWLAGADGRARCFRLRGHPAHRTAWGGIWSAPTSALATMADSVRMARACRCAESALVLSCAAASVGLEVSATLCAQVWPYDGAADSVGCFTLPIRTARQTRARDATAMFDFRA